MIPAWRILYHSKGISLHIPLWGYNGLMTHTCRVCGVTSDAAEFYKGLNTRCKECHKQKVRDNRAERADYYRTYDAYRYQHDPKVKKRHRRYAQTEEGKASLKAAREKWINENAEKRACHMILNNAVRDGRAIKPDACQSCGKTNCRVEGHHHDYTKPLDVEWLCRSCHVAEHRKQDEALSVLHKSALSFDATPKARGRASCASWLARAQKP